MKNLIWVSIALGGVAFALLASYCQAHRDKILAWLDGSVVDE